MPGSRSFKIRALCAILLPIIIAGTIITYVAVISTRQMLEQRADQFGGAIADQLAISVADQLVQHDVLGLNVTLGNLLAKGDFSFASVYSSDNKLLAQAGRNTGNLILFTRDVVFQNAAAGYVQVGLAPSLVSTPIGTILLTSILVHLILVSLIVLFGWSYADIAYLWLTDPGGTRAPPTQDNEPVDNDQPPEPRVIERRTILVIKIRPARLIATHELGISRALSLYRGDTQLTEGGDFVVTFQTETQVFEAIRAAMLVLALLRLGRDHATVKMGLHTAASAAGVAKATKQATYMASISENQLLASREIHDSLDGATSVSLQEFHSSLTPDGEAWYVDAIDPQSQELIDRQAKQLFGNVKRR